MSFIAALLLGFSSSIGVTLTPGAIIRSHHFDDGTLGAFVDPWGVGIDFPRDPTGKGHGRVARILYEPGPAKHHASQDRGFGYQAGDNRVRYGTTIWLRGQVYMPYAGSKRKANHNRKLIDFAGSGPAGIHTRLTLHRRDMMLYVSTVDRMGGSLRETLAESTGIRLGDDTWHTIEVRMTTNSADKVRDGVLEIYMDGATTPTYSRRKGLGWITEKYRGGSFFNWFGIGSQLTIDAGDPVYREYRYWDNVRFSTQRLAP
jgi:hypothetical protein